MIFRNVYQLDINLSFEKFKCMIVYLLVSYFSLFQVIFFSSLWGNKINHIHEHIHEHYLSWIFFIEQNSDTHKKYISKHEYLSSIAFFLTYINT